MIALLESFSLQKMHANKKWENPLVEAFYFSLNIYKEKLYYINCAICKEKKKFNE